MATARRKAPAVPGPQPEGQYGLALHGVVAGTDKDGREAAPPFQGPFAKLVEEGRKQSTRSTKPTGAGPEAEPGSGDDESSDFTSRIDRLAAGRRKPRATATSEAPAEPVADPAAVSQEPEQLRLTLERLEEELKGEAVVPKPGRLPIKDETITMDIPLFSLAKRPDQTRKVRHYVQGVHKVTIMPPTMGCATIFDKDLLIYIASLIVDAINRGECPTRIVDVDSAAFLTKTRRGHGRPSYERLTDMLMRLQGTNIHTNIETGGVLQMKGFGIIERYEILMKKERTETKPHPKTGKSETHEIIRPLKFRVTLSEWLYNSILDLKVLTIDDGYFALTTAIERRLYEIGRRHCGDKPLWTIPIDRLAEKVGTEQTMFQFREDLRFAIKDDRLPRYHVALDASVKPNVVVFYGRTPGALATDMARPGFKEWFESLDRHDSPRILEKAARGRRGRTDTPESQD